MIVTIDGRCPTKGSTRSFVNPKNGRVVTVADNAKLKQWTKDAKWIVAAERVPMIHKPHGVQVFVWVQFLKPKTAKQKQPTVRPDIDKCLRAVLDVLTGIAYADDSQVVYAVASKTYGPIERVTVKVMKADA